MGKPGVAAAALALLGAVVGCGSGSASADGSAGHRTDASPDSISIETRPDGAADGRGGGDGATACCTMDGTVLHMSWACYCEAYGCPTVSPNCGPLFTWTSACGLLAGRWSAAGGTNERVFDSKGAVVGLRLTSDVAEYGCGGDHTGSATTLEAGQLPAASCAATACSCNLDGKVDCSPGDSGAL
ncbi:MAG TPA: hypothetical protein VHM31_12535 [Polyangia bacterium]|nr:hypothetical protein [Polyangia bacterium]